MTLNQIKQAADVARTRTNDAAWLTAIDRAVAGFESWIVTELYNSILVTTENGTYHANGACQCRAYTHGARRFGYHAPCKHRALYRLIQIAREQETAAPAVSPRAQVIEDIKRAWPKDVNLADELMRRFKVNSLEFLNIGFLRQIAEIL